MATDIFVISDLHAGGAPGFRMLSEAGAEMLEDFSRWVAKKQPEGKATRVHLVINGDAVDFLAEEPWQAFSDEAAAVDKLESIIGATRPVWNVWKWLVERGGRITVMLGNHDVELCYPGVQRLLLETLGDGRVNFVFDNRALAIGDILIEHGNRYDPWNRVQHDQLREIRSACSRREPPPELTIQPGSELVVRVINDVKRSVDFIDLLKPEREGVLPLLSALAPGRTRKALKFLRQFSRSWFAAVDSQGQPKKAGYIKGMVPMAGERLISDEILAACREIAGGSAAISAKVARGDVWIDRWKKMSEGRQEKHLSKIRSALKKHESAHETAFDTDVEDDEYLKPATAAIARGFRLVVYGHTHLARRVEIGNGKYLNGGTWADLMRFPEVAYGDDDEAAGQALRRLVEDLVDGRSADWRFLYPTFVAIPGGDPERADVYLYKGDGDCVPVPAGVRPPPAMPEADE